MFPGVTIGNGRLPCLRGSLTAMNYSTHLTPAPLPLSPFRPPLPVFLLPLLPIDQLFCFQVFCRGVLTSCIYAGQIRPALSLFRSGCLSLSVCLFVCLFLSVYPLSLFMSVCLSVYVCVSLSVSVCLKENKYKSVCIHLSLSVSLPPFFGFLSFSLKEDGRKRVKWQRIGCVFLSAGCLAGYCFEVITNSLLVSCLPPPLKCIPSNHLM